MPSIFEQFKNEIIIAIMAILTLIILTLSVKLFISNSNLKDEKLKVANLNTSLVSYKDALSFQNDAILANKQDENKPAELPKVIHDIQTKTVVVAKEIIKFKEDTNVSKNDCNASMRFIDNFDYSL